MQIVHQGCLFLPRILVFFAVSQGQKAGPGKTNRQVIQMCLDLAALRRHFSLWETGPEH
jgi:hypothetical protein